MQFVRFILVGVLNTVVGYAVFVALLWVGMRSGLALVLATIAGVLFNFQTTRTLVFRGSKGGMLRFAAAYAFVLAVNWAALSGLEALGVAAWAAQGALALPLAGLSFTVQKLLVFSRQPEPA